MGYFTKGRGCSQLVTGKRGQADQSQSPTLPSSQESYTKKKQLMDEVHSPVQVPKLEADITETVQNLDLGHSAVLPCMQLLQCLLHPKKASSGKSR